MIVKSLMNKKINQYGSHFIDQVDIQKVIKVLENKDLTSGTEVLKKFEHDFLKELDQSMLLLAQWDRYFTSSNFKSWTEKK